LNTDGCASIPQKGMKANRSGADLEMDEGHPSGIFPLSSPHLTLYFRGRFAIVGALRLLGISDRDTLLLPSFICNTVTDVLDFFRYRYRFYPVTKKVAPDMEILEGRLTPEAKVLLFVNYFGFPTDCTSLLGLCRDRGVKVIEDNAHGFLGKDRCGDHLGSRGDIGIFSFPKTVNVPDGGGMVVNRPEILEEAATSAPASFILERQVSRGRDLLGLEQEALNRSRRRHASERQEGREEPWDISPITCRLLGKIEPAAVLDFRGRSYLEALVICEEEGFKPLYDGLEEGVCPYLLPIVAPPGMSRDRVTRRLEKFGYQVSHWPDLPKNLDGRPGDSALWLRENLMAVYLRPAMI